MKRWFSFLMLVAILAGLLPIQALAQEGGAEGATAQTRPPVYIVVLRGAPIATYQGELTGMPATKPGKGQKINPNSAHVKKYKKHLETKQAATLQGAGINQSKKLYNYTFALNGFAAQLTLAELAAVTKQPDVLAVLQDELRQPLTDSSPGFLDLNAPGGPYLKGYTGENVVVGVIDSGIWPEHPSFADTGNYSPLPVPLENSAANPSCAFGNTAHNPNDTPFTCNHKLIGARRFLNTYKAIVGLGPDEYDSARDDDGHGTHTASTAAGNANVPASIYGIPRGTIAGIAPRARVIAYKGLGNQGGFTSDLAAAIDQAVADGVDVINYSVGGGASLNGADDLAFLFAADAGVFAAVSAGNAGPGPATIGGPASVPWVTTVAASTQSRFFQGNITLGDGNTISGASITPGTGILPLVDAANAGSELCLVGQLNPALVSGKIVLCKRGVSGRVAKSQAVAQAGGAGMILYNAVDTDNLFTDNFLVPTVHIDLTPGLAIKTYIASTANPTAQISIGGVSEWPNAPGVTIFSSRGPNPVALDIIKPDVTAPGLQILAGNSPTPNAGNVTGQLFQAIAGTSMSSPHVAGLYALLKQAYPDWSAATAKSALMTTAYQNVKNNDRVNQANPFAMGAGHVNPGGKANKGSVFEPGLAYDAGLFEYFGFLCAASPDVFTNPAATCAALAAAGIPTQATNLNLASVGVASLPGSQTVIRTVTSVAKESGWRDYQVAVNPPPGYQVTVNPPILRLKKGESASYTITILNTDAPIGEWRFGSLTWRDTTGHYDVYSPMAVRASRFNAPLEVRGGGTSGSLSFDVRFGYSGAYTAAAHGLVPATVTTDNVVQDPDQNFSPTDGFSDLHTFNLTGAAYFRVAIPPAATEANADLDIYVFNPSNQLVASSTRGGTDEVVNITLPANGAWKVYVHGWAAPGGDSNYTLSSWTVSATPGGSLTLNAAPTAATLGTVGVITVGWSGLNTGTQYLGAVSHTGPSGIMGLTVVAVDPAANAINAASVSESQLDKRYYLPLIEAE